MLQVKCLLAPSPIHGLGLFAAQDIDAGDVVWRFTAGIDAIVTAARIQELTGLEQEWLTRFSWEETPGYYILGADFSIFMNHVDNPNTVHYAEELLTVAREPIADGTEITCDYRQLYRCRPKLVQL
jgi:SET domain-containing protein